jgi:hypothetical protein
LGTLLGAARETAARQSATERYGAERPIIPRDSSELTSSALE